MPLENGIPSHDTLGRVFAVLNSVKFEACFVRWMSALCPSLKGEIVAIDGKTARGSREHGQAALHMVSAFVCGRGITLGRWKTDEKSNRDHAPQNLNIVRKIAMNLLRLNPLKKTLPKKRLRACLDPAYLAQVLGVSA